MRGDEGGSFQILLAVYQRIGEFAFRLSVLRVTEIEVSKVLKALPILDSDFTSLGWLRRKWIQVKIRSLCLACGVYSSQYTE